MLNRIIFFFFFTGFRDSIFVFCIVQIIEWYGSRTGLTGYSVPPVLEKNGYRDVFIFFGTEVPGLLTKLPEAIFVSAFVKMLTDGLEWCELL